MCDWNSILSSVDDNVKDTARALTSSIIELHEVIHKVQGRQYCFYYGEPSKKTLFAAFLLAKKALKVKIRTDRSIFFKDPKRWTEDIGYKGYFLWLLGRRQEREFTMTGKEQTQYAMELITQAYLQTRSIVERRPLDRYKSVLAVMKMGWKRF